MIEWYLLVNHLILIVPLFFNTYLQSFTINQCLFVTFHRTHVQFKYALIVHSDVGVIALDTDTPKNYIRYRITIMTAYIEPLAINAFFKAVVHFSGKLQIFIQIRQMWSEYIFQLLFLI